MRNGDAATDAGGAKAFAFQQDVENFALLQAADLGASAGQFLEGLLFAGRPHAGDHTVRGNQIGQFHVPHPFFRLGRVLGGVNPTDMAVVTAIDNVDASVGIVTKDENRYVRQIHTHDRIADGHGFHFGGHFGDNHGGFGGLGRFLMLGLGRQDIVLGGEFLRLGSPAVVIQTALVAPQPLVDMFGGAVKGGIGGGVTLMTMKMHTAMDMHRDVGAEVTAFTRDRDVGFQGRGEIFFADVGHSVLDVTTERLADVDLLTLNTDVHP